MSIFHSSAAIIFVLCSFLFFHGLADRELTSSHEARAGQNAAMILETGQWGLPRLFDEQIELQKPPLYYWLVTLAALVHGAVDAWAIRLPAALAPVIGQVPAGTTIRVVGGPGSAAPGGAGWVRVTWRGLTGYLPAPLVS